MKVSILIGFQYSPNTFNSRSHLPGIAVDLYQAYVASVAMCPDQIIVITDINSDQKTSVLMKAIIDSIVDSDILTFIETAKSRQQYYRYRQRSDLMHVIAKTCYQADQVFFYYSGHAMNGHILLPDDQVLMTDLRDLLCTSVNRTGDIFITMDCCNGTGLGLPFQLMSNSSQKYVYRLSGGSVLELSSKQDDHPKVFFPTQRILCISSTNSEENSVTTRSGSIFTRSLFRCFKNRIRSIPTLLQTINNECRSTYQQTTTIHSSYPNLFILWNWLFGSSQIEVVIDPMSQSLIINPITKSTYPVNNEGICISTMSQ